MTRPPSRSSDTVQSTRSWKRRSAMSPGVTRKPHERANNADSAGLSQRAEIRYARGRTPDRAVSRSWARAKGPKAHSLAR